MQKMLTGFETAAAASTMVGIVVHAVSVTPKSDTVVRFSGAVDLSNWTGRIDAADGEFEGSGQSAEYAKLPLHGATALTVTTAHRIFKPGIYCSTLREFSQRHSDPATTFTKLQNVGSTRGVVR